MNVLVLSFVTITDMRDSVFEAISKKGFWFKFKAGPNFNPQAPEGSALGVHTAVFRGVEARDQHRNWAKKLF
jgi:hypothetical protein